MSKELEELLVKVMGLQDLTVDPL
uniref:Uncharacterized protein n=1 Tax=Rhizophora mucronata TaxID=61149 RepID=A0A2P2PGH4_RHIMU